VLVASNNRGKIPEIIAGLGLADWQFLSPHSLNITEVPAETGETYEENARIKAHAMRRAARVATGRVLPTLADDSGLEVDALDGAPGVHSARYGGEDATGERNVEKMLAALAAVPEQRRSARFICCIVYVDEEGHQLVARGVCEGHIACEPRGLKGFGYDPIFVPDEAGDARTMAELSPAEKDSLSHRGKALRDLREKLIAHYGLSPAGESAVRAAESVAPAASAPAAGSVAPAPASVAPAPSADPARIAAFDLDGTLLEGHSPVRMIGRLVKSGVISYRTGLQTLWWGVRYRLRLPAEQAKVREYVFRSFTHVPAAATDELMASFYHEDLRCRLRPRALEVIEEHRAAGDAIVLVSASFTPILKEVARDVRADWFICTRMEIEDGYYTGRVEGQPPEGEQKLIQLAAWADERYRERGWVLTAAYGDHRSDESLLAAAQNPAAVTPDTALERIARRKGWPILDWSFTPPEA
jgi:XTP/dITP diphosphohydrolase